MTKQEKESCRWALLPGETTSLFRRSFHLASETQTHFAVSADNRYRLWVDGKLIGSGPCRSDLEHYRYEEYTLQLSAGDHLLAAEVIRFPYDSRMPWAEIHADGGFWCCGLAGEVSLSTPGNWRTIEGRFRRFRLWSECWDGGAIPAPPMEEIDFENMPANWNTLDFDDGAWEFAQFGARSVFCSSNRIDPGSRHWLSCSEIPQMVDTSVAIAAIVSTLPLRLESGNVTGHVPCGTHTLLLDLGVYRTGHLILKFSSGSGACRIAYGEHLTDKVGNKSFTHGTVGEKGVSDLLHLTGEAGEFRPFTYRSGRFIELTFTLNTPIETLQLTMVESLFPQQWRARFSMPDAPELEAIYHTGLHTARCCLHEHYEDCPYWEQQQYVGDTRIQALISYVAAAEFRPGRQAIRQFDHSRLASGLTMSRYPVNFRQIIPQFSLVWILMIDDYFRYTGDVSIVTEHWKGMRDVLEFFLAHRDEATGLTGPLNGWNFSDWVAEWPWGCANRLEQQPDTLTSLMFAEACRTTARLWRAAGVSGGAFYEEIRAEILQAVKHHCYNAERKLFCDVPSSNWFSRHTNAWAILADALPPSEAFALSERILMDAELPRTTLYYRFYLLEAMRKVGNDNGFATLLDAWGDMLKMGYSTFPESPEPNSRSDCHAWSAGPVYEFLAHYAGVTPAEPGFAVINVAPHGKAFEITVPVGEERLLTVIRKGDTLHLHANSPVKVNLFSSENLKIILSGNIKIVKSINKGA